MVKLGDNASGNGKISQQQSWMEMSISPDQWLSQKDVWYRPRYNYEGIHPRSLPSVMEVLRLPGFLLGYIFVGLLLAQPGQSPHGNDQCPSHSYWQCFLTSSHLLLKYEQSGHPGRSSMDDSCSSGSVGFYAAKVVLTHSKPPLKASCTC